MTSLSFSRAARAHLLAIGRYTEETWEIKQRDLYLKKLFRRFDKLCRSPLSGKPRDALFAGMGSIQCEMHVVYYYYLDNEIFIVGVLHSRMEPELHLTERK
ncbi:MAG: type II toxin-antitoxin system RelE/ParE family toxin [Alphaproteobacteria bacterium]|nr:type II toxin-antitoxin system RelE/ParE family toxin [Alphaproteobacteria bacterium]